MKLRILAPPGAKIINEEGQEITTAKFLELHVEASDLTVAMLETGKLNPCPFCGKKEEEDEPTHPIGESDRVSRIDFQP